jgi:hypothetical protein
MEVVRLGAFADYATEDEFTSLRRQVTISIEEFAILADGRRLVFDDRGYSRQISGVDSAPDPWSLETVESVERDVRMTVLPDDDEIAAEQDHDWPHIAACLRDLGVAVSPDELMHVPYDVVLSERLRARLSG